MSEAEPAPVVSDEKVEVPAPPAEEAAVPAEVIADVPEVVAEVVEQGAALVEEVLEVVADAAEQVGEVAAAVAEVAEDVKAIAEEGITVAEEIKEEVAAVVSEEAPAVEAVAVVEVPAVEAVPLIEALAPVQTTFVEPVTLVEAVKAVAPPKYADLGKEARDLINKDFHSVNHLKVSTKSSNGFQFTTEKSHDRGSGLVGASLETKYNCDLWSLSTKWNTDSVISNTVSVANQGLDGLNVDIDTSYSLISGKKSMKVKTAYTGSTLFHPTLDLDASCMTKPNVDFSLVLAHQGFHAGYQTSFDSSASKLAGHNLTLGYKKDNLILTGAVENLSKYVGSVYYQIKEGVSAAFQADYTPGSSPNFSLCTKYDMGSDATFKAKVDQNLTMACSYITKIRPGVSLTASTSHNAKALSQGGHKVGLSLNFEA